ncbi:hypothetical protein [Mesorhizobium sp.]|uniref:hypothetical protein n=2 Tax=Mesorhizobium TaxID=68287 RepID=UPI0025DF8F13|nr:hypothetical protein [Mesorhizobium sp.]
MFADWAMLSRALRAANARMGAARQGQGHQTPRRKRLFSKPVPICTRTEENYSAYRQKIAIDKVYKFYRLTGETEVDMSYIQNAQTDRSGQRLANAQTFRPAYAGAFAYVVFALAFVFTGAVVLGLIP